jgi:hypothetical protein
VVEQIIGKIPGIGGALGRGLDELMEKTEVPEAISFHVMTYCSETAAERGKMTVQCFSNKALGIETTAVALALLYITSIASLLLGLSSSLYSTVKQNSANGRRYPCNAWIYISLFSAIFASIVVTVLGVMVHIVSTHDLLQNILQTGDRFLVITWSSCICLALGLAVTYLDNMYRDRLPVWTMDLRFGSLRLPSMK